jgi:hypothetical protein
VRHQEPLRFQEVGVLFSFLVLVIDSRNLWIILDFKWGWVGGLENSFVMLEHVAGLGRPREAFEIDLAVSGI